MKRLNEGHLPFPDNKKNVEIIEKNEARSYTSDLSKAQRLIIRRELTGNRYLNLHLVRILLKQLNYALSISMR